ncbi:SecY-interacting protein [Salinimonas chungwhensis]|jgi:SecY interacting protein Syd|uniref:SecY-interacting protein n=1 Tax=Salinimonas chungwhensis TaxID=265425 RepID=UPI00037073A8|nr:SecY-interacting protein [Salinimonas chungwhensis]
MSDSIEQAIDQLIGQYKADAQNAQQPLRVEYEPDWPTPCYQLDQHDEVHEGAHVSWQPVRQSSANSFAKLEDALELTLDQQYCVFFTRYYSFNLMARAPQGECELLQVVSDSDFERLQENLIGHVLMKRRLRQPETLFFGLTDDDNLILSIINNSGEVILERVGKKHYEVLAPDLSTFLNQLAPSPA